MCGLITRLLVPVFAFAAELSAAAEEAPAEPYQRCAVPWREACRCGASAVLLCILFYASTRSHLQLMGAIHKVPCARLYCQYAQAPFQNLPDAAYQHFPPQGSKAKLRDCSEAEGDSQRCALKRAAGPAAPPSTPALRCCLQNPLVKVGLQGGADTSSGLAPPLRTQPGARSRPGQTQAGDSAGQHRTTGTGLARGSIACTGAAAGDCLHGCSCCPRLSPHGKTRRALLPLTHSFPLFVHYQKQLFSFLFF